MQAIADHEGGKAGVAGTGGQGIDSRVKRRVGKAAVRIHLDHRVTRIMQHRHRIRHHLARRDHPQTAFDPVDAVRFAMIPLARDDHPRHRRRTLGAHARALENRRHPRQEVINGYHVRLGHAGGSFSVNLSYLSTSV